MAHPFHVHINSMPSAICAGNLAHPLQPQMQLSATHPIFLYFSPQQPPFQWGPTMPVIRGALDWGCKTSIFNHEMGRTAVQRVWHPTQQHQISALYTAHTLTHHSNGACANAGRSAEIQYGRLLALRREWHAWPSGERWRLLVTALRVRLPS